MWVLVVRCGPAAPLCAPQTDTQPAAQLHSPHRHYPSFVLLPATVEKSLKFQNPQKERRTEKPRRKAECRGAKVYAPQRQPPPEWGCVLVPRSSSSAPKSTTTGWRKCQASPPGCSCARGQSSRRGSAREGVPVHSEIMMLTDSEEAEVINW